MENIIIFLNLLLLIIIVFSIVDLIKNNHISKRVKTNYFGIIFLLPLLGSLIYFYTKRNYYEKFKK